MGEGPLYEFRELGDALAEVQNWGRRESVEGARELYDSCRFFIREGRGVLVRIEGESSARSLQLGATGVGAPEGLEGVEPLGLPQLFEQVRLSVRLVEPGDRLLALPRSAEAFQELVVRLADVRAEGQRVLRIRSGEASFDALEFEAPGLEVTAQELGIEDDELFVLSGEEMEHALPVGYGHPFLRSFPDLVPARFGTSDEGERALMVWAGGDDPSIGQWKAHWIEDGWSRPASRVELAIPEGGAHRLGGGTLDSIDLKLRPRRLAGAELFEGQSAILEIEDLPGNVTVQRLLDVLDDLELGRYSVDSRIWVHRTGRSRASRARFFMEVDGAAGAAVSHVRGLRVYLQSASLRERGIPLYVESRSTLAPDPDALLPELEQEHPFLSRLREVFPSDGHAEVHILRLGGRAQAGGEVFESLAGSQIVRDLLGVLRARPLGELASEAVEDLTERLSERSKEQFEGLASLARQETEHLDREFEDIAAAFNEQLALLEKRLADAHGKLDSAQELFWPVEGLIEGLPRTWDEIRIEIANLDENVVRHRTSWMKGVQSEVNVEQEALIRQARELENAVEATGPMLEEIESQRSQVESGFNRLKKAMSGVKAARSKILTLGEKVQAKFSEATAQLEEGKRTLGDIEAREAVRQQDLKRRLEAAKEEEGRLANIIAELDEEQTALQGQEAAVKNQLSAAKARKGALKKRRSELEAAEKELKKLTGTQLPALQASVEQLAASHQPSWLERARREQADLNAKIRRLEQARSELEKLENEVLPQLRSEVEGLRANVSKPTRRAHREQQALLDEKRELRTSPVLRWLRFWRRWE